MAATDAVSPFIYLIILKQLHWPDQPWLVLLAVIVWYSRPAEFPSRVLSPDAATVPDYIVIRQGTFDLDQLALPGSIPYGAVLESALFAMTGNSP
jgi:hypothetical protein